jgi:hypothetical protein
MHKSMSWVFPTAWIFVMAVSVVDGYLVLQLREVIGDFERNPAGIALLAINGGQVWLFLAMKLLGTSLACMWLLIIYRNNPRLGLAITLTLACFQFALLIYLHYA